MTCRVDLVDEILAHFPGSRHFESTFHGVGTTPMVNADAWGERLNGPFGVERTAFP
jgi:hypothetical protein